MKIFFIVDETMFLLPKWLDASIEKLSKAHEIVGATPLVTKGKPTWQNYLVKNIIKLGYESIYSLGMKFVSAKIRHIVFEIGLSKQAISTEQVLKKHGINILKTKNVNSEKYLKELRDFKPDIVVSSCSQIFKEKLLSLPRRGCINRHSSLLPSYGGVFPVFRAILNNEKYIGVTIHKMVKSIDRGKIIFQEKIKVVKHDSLFSLYQKAYKESVKALVEAINIIERKRKPVIVLKTSPSYYSFPKDEDWTKFFEKNHKFI